MVVRQRLHAVVVEGVPGAAVARHARVVAAARCPRVADHRAQFVPGYLRRTV